MALTGRVGMVVNVIETVSGDLEQASIPINQTYAWDIQNGLGLNQADRMWSDTRTLTTGATEDIDLQGSLAGVTGLKTFVKLKAVIIYAAPANVTDLTISRPAANGVALFAAASDALAALKPGGGFMWWDRSAAAVGVTLGTGDLITITNGAGASATYTIIVIGTSA